MDPRHALLCEMSAAQFELGCLYTLFQKIRRCTDTTKDTRSLSPYTPINLREMGVSSGHREER